jgi:predicted outer membrane protein
MSLRRIIPSEVAKYTHRTACGLSLAAAVMLTGCVKTQAVERTEYGQPPSPSQAAAEPALVPAVREAKIGAPVAQPLSDAEIIQILVTLDQGEIEQADVARKRATDAQVSAYADHMFEEHSRARHLSEQLAARSHWMPTESSLAEDLAGTSSQSLQTLKNADSGAFDELYIRGQVQQHQEVLDLLENHLIPRADDPSLKSHLQKARAMVDSHLSKAKEIQGTIGNGAR